MPENPRRNQRPPFRGAGVARRQHPKTTGPWPPTSAARAALWGRLGKRDAMLTQLAVALELGWLVEPCDGYFKTWAPGRWPDPEAGLAGSGQ